ncbi:MAG: UxaA family hydrolase [Bacillota bacterium]|jgi:altronate dehydratase|nr:UxaA family hydrolase [Bacillota bacterium]MDD3297800.1 UxaA family hydrolase [Bacillota bacterium]MDD3850842.1 UxaA family hydrolase [Bacillota bacterium]MDD4707527.1 UxaA family hydrolase [Bacillota bacterium]
MVLVINEKDNVGIALADLPEKSEVKAGEHIVSVKERVPFGHKVSLRDIKKGEKIIKYGEVIGEAIEDIKAGSHVHIHNMAGLRGRGDEKV